MALKAILDKVDDLPEAIQSEYVEKDGKFHLQVDAVDGFALENVAGLKSSLRKEREGRTKAEKTATAFEGLDASTVRTQLDELEALKAKDPNEDLEKQVKRRVESVKKQLGDTHRGELETRDKRINVLHDALAVTRVDNVAIAAISKHKGRVRALLPHVKASAHLKEVDGKFEVEVIDAEGNPRISGTDGNPMTIDQLVAEMKDDEDFSGLFEGSGHSGGGGKQPGGGKPQVDTSKMTSVQKIALGLKQAEAAGGTK